MSALLFALIGVVLIGATGLGVDTANLTMQRSRAQHGADAAAFAVAYDCIAGDAAKCSVAGGTATATSLAIPNLRIDGGAVSGLATSVPSGVSLDSTQVTIRVARTVDNSFISVFPEWATSTVTANATARWSKHVVKATVIPFAVSLCEYVEARAAGLNTTTFVSSDENDNLKDFGNGDKESWLDDNDMLKSCSAPSGVGGSLPGAVHTVRGGFWFSVHGNNICNGKTDPEVFEKVDDVQGANETCTKKWADDVAPKGTILLLAIHAPTQNYRYGGAKTKGAVGTGNGTPDDNPTKFATQIVGFAPFKVAGWCLGKPAACGGDSTGGRIGLLGAFIDSAKEFPDAEYGNEGAEFGAIKVELID
ncbi:Tad domain-containing protein [Aeromicrobium terrae]|uniref:Tad domain-containing protein n=1 Tax=Aeromicrobium terrae TaxID=2498846 RepID=UPI0016503111|nr:Tad domain-containing protein [Aeromicrobium terrae]